MAAKERQQNQIQYFQTFQGRIVQTSKEERNGFKLVQKTDKKTQVVTQAYVKEFDSIEGYVSNIELVQVEFKDGRKAMNWRILLIDGEEAQMLTIPLNSGVAGNFMKRIGGADFSKMLEIAVFPDKTDGKAVLLLKQNGQTVPFQFTKDNLNGMPPMKFRQATQEWDSTDQTDWLVEFVKGYVAHNLQLAKDAIANASESAPAPAPNQPVVHKPTMLSPEAQTAYDRATAKTDTAPANFPPQGEGEDDLPF